MVVHTDSPKARRHRRRQRRHTNQSVIGMSDASTRSGSPSSSQGISEVAFSHRGSGDAGDSERLVAGSTTSAPRGLGTEAAPPIAPPQCTAAVESQPTSGAGLSLSGTSPARKPCPLSPAALGDASQRQPMSNAGTPVSSPSKMHSFTATCGSRLLLPKAGLLGTGDLFQSSPAGTPAATPMGRGFVVATSPSSPCKSAKPGPVCSGDASQRTPLASPIASQSFAMTSWLCGSPCGRLPSGPELAELLKAALPETYDD